MNYLFLLLMFFKSETKNTDTLIFWQHTLTYSDFLKNPDFSKDTITAESFVGFKCDYNYDTETNKFEYSVKAFFDPNKSWIKINDTAVLKHEQLHFDIAELFARKLRNLLSYLKVDFTIDEKVEGYIKKTEEEMKQYQNLFDKETFYSRNKLQEEKWRNKIQDQLKEYERFR